MCLEQIQAALAEGYKHTPGAQGFSATAAVGQRDPTSCLSQRPVPEILFDHRM